VPHTVLLQEFLVVSGKEDERAMLQTEAVRSDGFRVRRIDYTAGRLVEAARWIETPTGELYKADDVRGTWSKGRTIEPTFREPRQDCLATADGRTVNRRERLIGREPIGDYQTVALQDGGTTMWRALELNCTALKVVISYSDTDRSEQRLQSITLGEPAAGLFSLDGLKESPPGL
jgi:hypothetical protein